LFCALCSRTHSVRPAHDRFERLRDTCCQDASNVLWFSLGPQSDLLLLDCYSNRSAWRSDCLVTAVFTCMLVWTQLQRLRAAFRAYCNRTRIVQPAQDRFEPWRACTAKMRRLCLTRLVHGGVITVSNGDAAHVARMCPLFFCFSVTRLELPRPERCNSRCVM
jgi:hypothetical protein